MADDEQPMTAGDLLDMIPPGETVRFGGFEVTRWPEPAKPRRRRPSAHDPLCFEDRPAHPHDIECECWCHDEANR